MDLYREELLDHYKNPRNFGKLENATKHIHEANPLCGDVIDLDVLVENDVIKDIKFSGQGCAISVAATSMLSEKVKGMSLEDAKKITRMEIVEMINPTLTMSRIKCATLGLKALQAIL